MKVWNKSNVDLVAVRVEVISAGSGIVLKYRELDKPIRIESKCESVLTGRDDGEPTVDITIVDQEWTGDDESGTTYRVPPEGEKHCLIIGRRGIALSRSGDAIAKESLSKSEQQ
jgi:hypothetical protein